MTGKVIPLLDGLQNPIGILLAPDGHTVYITEQLSDTMGQLVSYDLLPPDRSSAGQILDRSTSAPYFDLCWANAAKTAILMTERDPANKVWYFDLERLERQLVYSVARNPSSVAVVSKNGASLPLLVCADVVIDKLT